MNWFPKSTLETGWGLDLSDVDLEQASGAEHYICSDCHRKMLLTTNGRCGVCNSSAVYPFALIEGGKP